MRLIIAGSRTADTEADYAALKHFAQTSGMPRPDEIITGDARGADKLGNRLAQEFGIPLKTFTPDWDRLGKGAGHLRNGDMAVYASDEPNSGLIAIWDGQSKGTAGMIEVAKRYGLHVAIIPAAVGALPDPRAVLPLRDITPPDPYIFPQSHSSLNVFETCPRQYEAKYIIKDSPYVQSAEAAFGDQVHNALEAYLKANGQMAMPSNMVQYKTWGDWVLARAAQRGGVVHAERKSAVSRDKVAVSYQARNRWIGGKIDVTIVYPNHGEAEVFDWKTGKIKNDQTQLQLYGALGLADFPDVQTVRAGYIWLAHGTISPPSVYAREDYAQHWDTFEHKYLQLQDAYRRGVFPPKPNGLCQKWCDVKRCEFHGKGRR
jgi:hypothetical protein